MYRLFSSYRRQKLSTQPRTPWHLWIGHLKCSRRSWHVHWNLGRKVSFKMWPHIRTPGSGNLSLKEGLLRLLQKNLHYLLSCILKRKTLALSRWFLGGGAGLLLSSTVHQIHLSCSFKSWTSSSQTSLKMCLQSIFWETITSREVCNLPPLPSTFMSLITSCPLAGHDLTQQSWPRLSSPRCPLLLCPLISPLSSSLSSPVKLSHWSSFYWVLLSAPSPPVQAPVPFWIWMDLL